MSDTVGNTPPQGQAPPADESSTSESGSEHGAPPTAPPGGPPGVAPAPQVQPAQVPQGSFSLSRPVFQIAIPDLRNGALISIQQAAPRAAMSGLYHWPIIVGLTHDLYIDAIDHVTRAIFAHGLHMLGAAADDSAAAAFRRKAIVLAGVRIGAVSSYKLTRQDLVQSELAPSGMTYSPATRSIGQTATGTTSASRWTGARSMEPLTADEMDVVATCIYMGMAIPVLQGVSLVMTGHHYIPSTYNLFKGLKRQAVGQASTATRTWIDAMGEDFDDMAFHKATHSMSFNLKRSLSKSIDTAARLKASGHGSAAIRLPAVPSEASGGKAAIALLQSAEPTITQMGGTISYSIGLSLLSDLDAAAEGQPEADACDAVVRWVATNSRILAFCAGVVQQVHETSGTGRNTILAAYSIKRIMADCPAEVNRGIMYARAASSRMRQAMEDGTYQIGPIAI